MTTETEPTPGQAAYEAFQAAFPYEDWGPWTSIGEHDDEVPGSSHAGWEAIAQAVLNDAFPGLRRQRDEAVAEARQLREQLSRVADAANVVLDAFTRGSDGYRARLSGVTLMRAYKAIGRPVPDRLKHLEGQ